MWDIQLKAIYNGKGDKRISIKQMEHLHAAGKLANEVYYMYYTCNQYDTSPTLAVITAVRIGPSPYTCTHVLLFSVHLCS
jgi:hypothetical protein